MRVVPIAVITACLAAAGVVHAEAPSSVDAGHAAASYGLGMHGTGVAGCDTFPDRYLKPSYRRGKGALPPSPAGDLDRGPIRRVIQRHRGEIAACYQAALTADPRLKGRLAVRFGLDARGAVTHLEIRDSTMQASTLDACVIAHWKRWGFPVVGHGLPVTLTYPLKFEPPTKPTPPRSSSRSPSR